MIGRRSRRTSYSISLFTAEAPKTVLQANRLRWQAQLYTSYTPPLPGVFQGSRGFRGRGSGGSGARWVNRPVSADAPGDVWSTAAAASEVEAAIFLRHKSRAPPWLVASKRPPRWCVHDSGSVRPVATKVRATSLGIPLTSPMCSAPLRSRPHLTHRQYVVKRRRRCSSTLRNAAAASRRCRSPLHSRSRAQFR